MFTSLQPRSGESPLTTGVSRCLQKCRRYAAALVVLISAMTIHAQQPVPAQQPPGQAQQPFTISVRTQLVIETVVVGDKDGKAIEDLTAKDFSVTEDGVPQTISVFEYQKLQ